MAIVSDVQANPFNLYRSKWYDPSDADAETCLDSDAYPVDQGSEAGFDYYYEVTSYRGKIQYVQVQGKRRRVFHPFTVFKHWNSTNDTWKLCSKDSSHCYIVVERAMSRELRVLTRALLNGDAGISGTPCYTCCKAGMVALANDLREPLVRDIYEKANAPVFEGAVFLAELAETVTSLRHLLVGTLKGITKVTEKSKQLKHLLLHPEELWLWYRYFLLPAMLDAEDIIAAFQEQLPIDRVSDGIEKTPWETVTGSIHADDCTYSPWPIDINYESKYRYSGGGAIDLIFRHDPHKWGVSAYDLVRAGWEIIPFSFVLDWFYDVGSWLASWRSVDMEIAQSYATIVVEGQTKISSVDQKTWHNYDEEYYADTLLIDRVIDIEPPISPRFNNEKLSLFRTIDACSLTLGILRGFLNRRK
jgi:hypothetical protein